MVLEILYSFIKKEMIEKLIEVQNKLILELEKAIESSFETSVSEESLTSGPLTLQSLRSTQKDFFSFFGNYFSFKFRIT
jgi:hypothetical protein